MADLVRLDLLVGLHGSGLTNLLLLPPHSVAIEIFQKGFHAYDYQMMAELAGIDYFGFEAIDAGHVYRDWYRGGPGGSGINQPVDQLPERRFELILDVIEARFSAGG
jgi:hypothetical protein